MKKTIILLIYFGICSANHEDWTNYKLLFGKKYNNQNEELFRRKVYEENKKWITEHNELFLKGQESYKVKMNKYGDLTDEEFEEMFLKANPDLRSRRDRSSLEERVSASDIPDFVDWRQRKAVTRVRDQGVCGSCWAFSATGSLEGMQFLKTGKLVALSAQELLDCSDRYGNRGCKGGLPEHAFDYIKDNGGIDTEEFYPYYRQDPTCGFNETQIGAKITGYVNTKEGDERDLQEAVARVGPVSVCIYASKNFKFYSEGVFKDVTCYNKSINHAVLVVGYGVEDGQDYWLVKNSWGIGWGELGYIKMARNSNNHCAIANYGVYPLV